MDTEQKFASILEEVKNGSLYSVNQLNIRADISKYVVDVLNLSDWSASIVKQVGFLLEIANIVYYNSAQGNQILTDGVYDLLLSKYKMYNSKFKVGALPVRFDEANTQELKKDFISAPYTIIGKAPDMIFYENFIDYKHQYGFRRTSIPPYSIVGVQRNENIRNIAHNNLDLVGTLDKCKFVLNKQAYEKGVLTDPKVDIFERDFLGKHVREGIVDPDNITLIAELKYDGISVEGEIVNGLLKNPKSRGDTAADKATDFSAFLGDYQFPRAKDFKEQIGVKFEAIVMTPYLIELQNRFGLTYVNARNAINGISGRLDANRFRDYITLVPLRTDIKDKDEADGRLDRLVEINFLNEYIAREVNLKYAIIQGDYASVLWQVKRFVEEAEYMRSYMPFMYDGVVIEYYGAKIRKRLGRENFVDKFSIAIKFTPLKVDTQFIGYDFTIGQNGVITPMAYYNPVEFYGTIHNHSSVHSYKRFKELNLKPGDIISVEYMNDVMPYVSKPDIEVNDSNPNAPIEFIRNCPCCGTPIEISSSEKSARCPNRNCQGVKIARLSNMLSKLDFKDFNVETVTDILNHIQINSLMDLMSLTEDQVSFLGPNRSKLFVQRIKELQTTPINDYIIIGSLGFYNIAQGKWKLILQNMSIEDIIHLSDDELYGKLINTSSIGYVIAHNIVDTRGQFMFDLDMISKMPNVIRSYGSAKRLKIRFSGVRDKELVRALSAKGHDIGEGSVTKDTDILIVPNENHVSTKTQQAVKYGVRIITLAEAMDLLNS